MKLKPVAALAAMAFALAMPASAQNSAAEAPDAATPPKVEPAPPAPSPSPPASETAEPARPVVVQPAPQPVAQPPVTISPDAAYPNGFADPSDPFANDMALAYRDQGGFDWGLLGLLGLLGLIPLFRGGGRRIVYVERDEEPRRVVRRERIED